MSTHNYFYLPDDLWALPQAIFMIASIRERSLYNGIKYAVERDMELAESDLLQVAHFPHLAAEFIVSGWISERETAVALQSPALRFDVLAENYAELCTKLEPGLMGDYESVERLIVYSRSTKKPLRLPESRYMQVLIADPSRYMRLAGEVPDVVVNDLLSDTLRLKDVSPEHALFFLETKGLMTVEEHMEKVLKKSDQHVFLAARHLKRAGAPSEIYSRLVDDLNEPRWIYHALKFGLLTESSDVIKKLCRHPGWAVEWMVLKRAPIEEVEAVYLQCKTQAHWHPCLYDLDLWFKRRQVESWRHLQNTVAA